jgi:hypothetical protein
VTTDVEGAVFLDTHILGRANVASAYINVLTVEDILQQPNDSEE